MKKELILFIVGIFFAFTAEAQHILTRENTLIRPGDVIDKEQVVYQDPGESGFNLTWDFRNVELVNNSYRIEHVGDSTSMLLSIHPKSMNHYQIAGDTLFRIAYEDPLTKLVYHNPVPELRFPFTYGDVFSASYEGKGLYCRHNGVEEAGTVFIEADAIGTFFLTEEDTLRNVLRVHTVKTSVVGMDKDSIVTDSTKRVTKVEDIYRWYARGYRYPVFETLSETCYDGTKCLYNDKVAYRTLPEYLRSLGDSINEEIIQLDSLQSDSHEPDIIQYQVQNAGGNLKVDYSLSERATISALISDTMGIVYKRYEHTDEPGENYSFSFNLNGLHRGEYILYLNVNGRIYSQTVHKN